MVTIGQIESAEDCAAVKALVLEFFDWARTQDPDADDASTFADLQAELDGLPGIFAPPGGCFLLARNEGQVAGCLALRALGDGKAEVKRMYVRPDQRGGGVGAQLTQTLIGIARAQGHRQLELLSYHTMTGAHRVYRAAGFRDVAPPADFPAKWQGRVVFMEMDL